MKKVLVTGATGYLGNYVVQELLGRGVEVIASARNPAAAANMTRNDKLTFLPLDINNDNSSLDLYDYFMQPDMLIHLAWGDLDNFKSSMHIDEHLPNHLKFLDQIIKNGLKDLTITGTCLEYGMHEGRLLEEMEANPVVSYAKAKNELRINLQHAYPNLSSLKWLRLFYMFGQGQQSKSLISQLDAAIASGDESFNMSGGEQQRDFLPVEKMASYIVAVALQEDITGIVNCCSGRPVKVKDFVKHYLAKSNKTIKLNLGYYPYPDYEPMEFWGSNIKLKKIVENDKSN